MLKKLFSGLYVYLTTDNVAFNIHNHVCLLLSIIFPKLAKVLNAQRCSYIIGPGSSNEAIRRKVFFYCKFMTGLASVFIFSSIYNVHESLDG
jgi:hypothetical protein